MTPVAAVDEAVRERNLRRMQESADAHGLCLRPHAKTHKSAFVARRQIAHGATGLTAATMREAEVFAAAVGLDTVEVAESVPAPIELLWEVDTGLHRLRVRRRQHGPARHADARGLRPGRRRDGVAVVPAHACTTVNLHPELLLVGDGAGRWEPVDARGWR